MLYLFQVVDHSDIYLAPNLKARPFLIYIVILLYAAICNYILKFVTLSMANNKHVILLMP